MDKFKRLHMQLQYKKINKLVGYMHSRYIAAMYIVCKCLAVFILPTTMYAQSLNNTTPSSASKVNTKTFISINQTEQAATATKNLIEVEPLPKTKNKFFVPEPTIAEQRLYDKSQSSSQSTTQYKPTKYFNVLDDSGVVLNKKESKESDKNINNKNNTDTQLIIPLIVESKAYQKNTAQNLIKNQQAINNAKTFMPINNAEKTIAPKPKLEPEIETDSIDYVIKQNNAANIMRQPPKLVEVSLQQANNLDAQKLQNTNKNIVNKVQNNTVNNFNADANNEIAIQNIISMQSSQSKSLLTTSFSENIQNKNTWNMQETNLDKPNNINNASNIGAKIIPQLLENAKNLLGVPYRYGGNTPSGGMDCSGFVRYIFYYTAGMNLPRTTREIARYGRIIDKQNLRAGDLVFFNTRGNLSHLGIYMGDNSFIHAPSSGSRVRIESLNTPYWNDKYDSAKRLIAEN
jgi:cell wall-associated NlpC family hydrolase